MHTIRLRFSQLPPWQQRLLFALVVLIGLSVVSSFTVAELLHLRQGSTTSGSDMLQLRRGWTQIATYHGTGNRTIIKLRVPLPQLWGLSLTCEGKSVTGELDGTNETGEKNNTNIGVSPCSASVSKISPQSIFLSQQLVTLQTVTLMASQQTTWHLQLVRAAEQPNPALGKDWIFSMGMGGRVEGEQRSNGSSSNLLPLLGPSGQRLLPKTYEIAFACFGSGLGKITLTPAQEATLQCDGHVRFAVVRYPTATQLEAVNVSITSAVTDTVWSTILLGCRDEQRCGKLPVTGSTLASPVKG